MREHVAFIREDICIGCTKCIDVCPTDAIIGAKNTAHTVVKDLCIACDLCLPPCPVNCIDLIPTEPDTATQKSRALDAKARIQSRLKRLADTEKREREIENNIRTKTSAQRKMEIERLTKKGHHEKE